MNFLREYHALFTRLPHPALTGGRNEKAAYCDTIWHSYNTYYSFNGGRLKNCAYMYACTGANAETFSIDCFDCYQCNSCELCYECFSSHNCYHSGFLEYCRDLTDCYYCIDCRNCTDVFGSVGLTHKQYCILNKQYSKETYEKKRQELLKKPPEEIFPLLKQVQSLLPVPPLRMIGSENCLGDYLSHCKNCFHSFFATACEDSAYLTNAQGSKDCFDCSGGVHMSELCYECLGIGHSYNCSYSSGDYLTDCHYCTNCLYTKNCFGCVNLNKAQFCILNKQYSEKEYWQTVAEIKKELDRI